MILRVLGTVRTHNFKDPDLMKKIGGLWSQHEQRIQQTFQSKQAVFAVYHDYASNYKGDYSISLCVEGTDTGEFDTSLFTWKTYAVDGTSETGIIDTWKQIWQDEDQHSINRLYAFDYEQYLPDGGVSIQLSIKHGVTNDDG